MLCFGAESLTQLKQIDAKHFTIYIYRQCAEDDRTGPPTKRTDRSADRRHYCCCRVCRVVGVCCLLLSSRIRINYGDDHIAEAVHTRAWPIPREKDRPESVNGLTERPWYTKYERDRVSGRGRRKRGGWEWREHIKNIQRIMKAVIVGDLRIWLK